MAKKVLTLIKLQIPGGQANPAPPVGPALGQHGVNIMEFCKAFNAQTAQENGRITPVEITVYEDRSLHVHHEDAAGRRPDQGGAAAREGLGRAEPDQGRQAHRGASCARSPRRSSQDLNARDVDQAMLVIAGTARSHGRGGGAVMAQHGKRYREARGTDRPRAALLAGRGGPAAQGRAGREVRRDGRGALRTSASTSATPTSSCAGR